MRCRAAEALGKIGDPRCVEPLIAALKDAETNVRGDAALALGKIGDPRAFTPLIAALNDSHWIVRGQAARELGKIRDARAVEPLLGALKDSREDVRKDAAEALARIGKEPVLEPLVAELEDLGNVPPWLRKMVIETLDKIDPSWRVSEVAGQAVRRFVASLEDLDLKVRMAAASALREMRWEPRDQRERELYASVSEIESFMASRGLVAKGEEITKASSDRALSSVGQRAVSAAAIIFDRTYPYRDQDRVVDDLLREMKLEVNRHRTYTTIQPGIRSGRRGLLPQICRDAFGALLGSEYDEESLEVTPFEMEDGTGGVVVFHP